MKKRIYNVKHIGTMQKIIDTIDTLERLSMSALVCISDHKRDVFFSDNVLSELNHDFFENSFANTYFKSIIEVVKEIDEQAGGYGYEALVLICSMLKECIRLIAAGTNQVDILKSIKKLRMELNKELGMRSRSIDADDKVSIINLLNQTDVELGECIVNAFEDVGYNGLIQFDASNSFETIYKCIEGHYLERGFMSVQMATDDNKKECVLDNPVIVVTERPIIHVDDIVYFITKAAEKKRPLLLIAEHVEDKPLSVMLYNKKVGKFKSAAIQAPKYGTERKLFLSDIAAIVGATVITADILDLAESIKGQHEWMLGGAERVVITKDRTVIYNGEGDKNEVAIRCNNLMEDELAETDKKEKQFISDRVALLSGKVGRIYIGGIKAEVDAKKRKAERMIVYAREAVKTGTIIEAPYALLHASYKIYERGEKEDYIYKELCRILASPLRAKLKKAGLTPEIIIEGLRDMAEIDGYDTEEDAYIKDMFSSGNIASAGSLITATDKALSLIGVLCSAEYLVIET